MHSRTAYLSLLASLALVAIPLIFVGGQAAVSRAQAPDPGQPAVVVPAPPNATPEMKSAVAESAARNLQDVASGAVPLEKATRDLREALDPGSNVTFWVLSLVVGLVFRPIVDAIVHRIPSIPDDLGGRITLGCCLLFFVVAWVALHKGRPDLPQDWESWLFAGFGANGAGTATALAKAPRVTP